MNIETYGAFVIATIILMLIPGPTVLLVISYALAKGRSVALAVVGGAVIGVLLSMVATLLGVGLILATSKTLFIIMKWIGVAYLAWMGWKMIRTSETSSNQISNVTEESHFSAFRDSMIVTFFNPKSIGFFVVFVPQFVNTSTPLIPQFVIMIITFVSLGAINTFLYAMLAAKIRHTITRPSSLIWVQRVGGGILILLAIYSALLSYNF